MLYCPRHPVSVLHQRRQPRVSERYSVAIRDMPLEERPRERLIHHGPEALSNQELLAILLRTGTARESALALAGRILSAMGGLKGIAEATIPQLSTVNGVGPAKAVEIR